MDKKSVSWPIVVGLVLAVGVVSFWGGTKYRSKNPMFDRGSRIGIGGSMPGGFGGRNSNGNQIINGEIIAADDSSVTVKTAGGSSQIVLLTGTTIFKKMTDGDKADLVVGSKVMITGTKDTNGNVSATQVSTGVETPMGGRPQGGPPLN